MGFQSDVALGVTTEAKGEFGRGLANEDERFRAVQNTPFTPKVQKVPTRVSDVG